MNAMKRGKMNLRVMRKRRGKSEAASSIPTVRNIMHDP